MDKNVQHVDLDEIRKAREALNNELGITTPQDNYSKKTKKQEEETPLSNTAENNDNNDLDSQSNFNELDEEENVDRDFSVYDNFSQFEINKDIELKDNSPKKVEPVEIEEDEEDDYEEFVEEEKPELQKPTDLDDLLANITSIDDLMNMDLSGIQISEDENVDNISEPVEEVKEEVKTTFKEEPKIQNTFTNTSVKPSEKIEKVAEKVAEEKKLVETEKETDEHLFSFGDSDTFGQQDFDSIVDEFKEEPNQEYEEKNYDKDNLSAKIDSQSQSNESVAPKQSKFGGFKNPYLDKQNTTPSVVLDVDGNKEPEKKAEESLDKKPENTEAQIKTLQKEENEKPKDALKKIDDFNFIDIIKSQSFMDSDELTCIYGIDEDKNVICQNFKDFYNTIIFSENDDEIFKFFSSIIMSLTLKNSTYAMKFVICDSKNGSKFDVYNDLSYMFFSRVAKSTGEIVDSLEELSREIDKRYDNLAKAGAKNIEEFNELMKSANIAPMPYTLLLFNNYTRAIHLDENDDINAKLSYILKYGRLVGVYVNLVLFDEKIEDRVNFNLQTRISFKADSKEVSMNRLAESGAEKIAYGDEYVCKTLFSDKLVHLKVPNITQREVELLIKNIEN